MRIVSLVPSLTEAVAQLGVGRDLVAVTKHCIHPAVLVAGLERIGGTKDPDLGRLHELDPDVVLANTDEQRAETLDALRAWDADGDRLVVTQTDNLNDVARTWTKLGEALGRQEAAAAQRTLLEAAIERARKAARTRRPLGVLVPVWKHPWMASGGGTYLEDLLHACGFRNVFESVDEKWLRFAMIVGDGSVAQVDQGPAAGQAVFAVPMTPDIVLLPTEPYNFTEPDRDDFGAIGVPRERVRVVDGEALTWWLSRTVAALETFTQLHARLVDAVERTR